MSFGPGQRYVPALVFVTTSPLSNPQVTPNAGSFDGCQYPGPVSGSRNAGMYPDGTANGGVVTAATEDGGGDVVCVPAGLPAAAVTRSRPVARPAPTAASSTSRTASIATASLLTRGGRRAGLSLTVRRTSVLPRTRRPSRAARLRGRPYGTTGWPVPDDGS